MKLNILEKKLSFISSLLLLSQMTTNLVEQIIYSFIFLGIINLRWEYQAKINMPTGLCSCWRLWEILVLAFFGFTEATCLFAGRQPSSIFQPAVH